MMSKADDLLRRITWLRRGWFFAAVVLMALAIASVGIGLSVGGGHSATARVENASREQPLATAGRIALSLNAPVPQQVAWLCQEALTEVESHNASGFMKYVDQRCNAEGSVKISSTLDTAMPLGALICKYAEHEVLVHVATRSDQMMAAGCAHPPIQPTGIAPAPAEDWSLGIDGTNLWNGYMDGHYTTVIAGAEVTHAASGGAPHVTNNGEVMVVGGIATTTSATGSLRITSANDGVLLMAARDGAHYRFDVQDGELTKTDP